MLNMAYRKAYLFQDLRLFLIQTPQTALWQPYNIPFISNLGPTSDNSTCPSTFLYVWCLKRKKSTIYF